MSSGKRYRVKQVFYTLQGEGKYTGRPAVFVRFVGCNMWSGREEDRQRDSDRLGVDGRATCSTFCDTDFTAEGSREYTAKELVAEVLRVGDGCRFVVMTGGEPLLQMDRVLIRAFHYRNLFVSVETNGTVNLDKYKRQGMVPADYPDHIVCSPKLPPDQLKLERCHELKLVVPTYNPRDYEEWAGKHVTPMTIKTAYGSHKEVLLWVQPEDGSNVKQATTLCIAWCEFNPSWRLSYQMHKAIGVE